MAAFPRATAFAVVLVLTSCTHAPSPTSENPSAAEPTRTPSDPAYHVRLRASPDLRGWTGAESVAFTNRSADPLARVWLRLWSNGVQGCSTRAISISNLHGGIPGDLGVGCTAVPVTLDTPLAPGDRVSIGFDLTIRLPARNDRFGVYGGLALVGNAIPTLAVLDDEGWHLEPYVAFGESFYSVVGRYRVRLDVPTGLDVPATGPLVARRTEGDRTILSYAADDVRDFAWAAGDLSLLTGKAGDVTVHVWYRATMIEAARARTMLGVAEDAVSTYSRAFGTYPYPDVDVVLTAFQRFKGMEYPGIVFANPEQDVVAHELAHQWWFGIVGDDEYAEPWLDEAFATWSQFLPSHPWQNCDAYDWPSAGARLTNDMAYWRSHPDEYGTIYAGGGCMLANLAHRFGLVRFEHVLARYAAEHWLGVARTEDFQAAVERAAARSLPGFDVASFWSTWRVG
jgi:Peptidase family M1 domain